MYVRGYLQGSENGRVVTIESSVAGTTTLDREWQLLLSVKWRHMFSYKVKTGPIYGMETNIKSENG